MKIIAVYKITAPDGRIYIGASQNLKQRWRSYRRTIFLKKGTQRKIMESFNLHGVKNHLFEIIEECEAYNLNDKERYWQDFYDVIGVNGLNGSLVGGNGKKGKMSDEQKYLFKKNFVVGKKSPEYLKWFVENVAKKSKKGIKKSKEGALNIKEFSGMAKIVLDTETGIYYRSAAEAAEFNNIKHSTLKQWMNNSRPLKIPRLRFIYA